MQKEFKRLKDYFGPEYSECVSGPSLDYIIEKGISSGLKEEGFSSEQIIADALASGKDCERANLIVNLQNRDLLARIAKRLDTDDFAAYRKIEDLRNT